MPKRKASAAISEEDPPFKRRTRSSGPLVETQPAAVPKPPATRRRATKASLENIEAAPEEEAEHTQKQVPRKRGRAPASKAAATTSVPTKSPSPEPQELQSLHEESSEETVAQPAVPRRRGRAAAPAKPAKTLPRPPSRSAAPPSPPKTRRRAVQSKAKDSADTDVSYKEESSKGLPRSRTPVEAEDSAMDEPVSTSSKVQLEEFSSTTSKRVIRTYKSRGTKLKSVGSTRTHTRSKQPVIEIREEEVIEPLEAVQEEEDGQDASHGDTGEPDELLLKASSPEAVTPPLTARPATPTRASIPRSTNGTPRYMMHSVEITTPTWLSTTRVGSPRASVRRDRTRTPSVAPVPSSSRLSPILPTPTKPRTPRRPQSSPKRPIEPITEEASEFEEFPVEISSPPKRTPGRSPAKGRSKTPLSPSKHSHLPRTFPEHLEACMEAQKRATLASLANLPEVTNLEEDEPPPNVIAQEQLNRLLLGTVQRAEGNSCLITGPRGSGKTRLVEDVIASLPVAANVIRLSGHAQTNDRLAIREIAWQLAQQTGASLMPFEDTEDGPDQDADNPFIEKAESSALALPPSAHLLALISVIPTLSRPTIILLDAFDLFALHPRQSLLYCLFDTVQHSRVGTTGKGLAVVGITARVDTINLLEKRVKSRFSGRILRTACPGELDVWKNVARQALCAPIDGEYSDEWTELWESAVEKLLDDKGIKEVLLDTFALTRDLRTLSRILIPPILELTSTSPFPTSQSFVATVQSQRCPTSSAFLHALTYPSMCLLIAATHAQTSGHDVFTFEMLYEAFCDQVRTSQSAPVQVEGGGIGMMRCSREVLMAAFEQMVSVRAFLAVAGAGQGTSKGFMKYRCRVDRKEVKQAVEKMGQSSLKKWFGKAQ
ncbi:origin recognition complex subunit 4 C-terminus-domain-containing protein [Cristinia sonorae]|uniref:Origin recognition complex subunit 4 C-terminus-domain-containing protein n=1 Tax=Cristinia sonorae TaxID=1940300 RepID=A0A8K0XTN2_9AGAR|nr:origin recognition complex subunit 4 C-terminus-domain-containing protein [Cristinia sonorae]